MPTNREQCYCYFLRSLISFTFISKSDPICFIMKSLLLVLCYYLYSYFLVNYASVLYKIMIFYKITYFSIFSELLHLCKSNRFYLIDLQTGTGTCTVAADAESAGGR